MCLSHQIASFTNFIFMVEITFTPQGNGLDSQYHQPHLRFSWAKGKQAWKQKATLDWGMLNKNKKLEAVKICVEDAIPLLIVYQQLGLLQLLINSAFMARWQDRVKVSSKYSKSCTNYSPYWWIMKQSFLQPCNAPQYLQIQSFVTYSQILDYSWLFAIE